MADERTLEEKVDYLLDRIAIQDCIAQHARGHDRHDVELLTDTYHHDGVDEHGHQVNSGPAYAEWANTTHAMSSASHLHNVTTHSCEIDGDVAHAESYVIGMFTDPGAETSRMLAGRYIDRLERRDGKWGIVLRRATVEVILEGKAVLPNGAGLVGSGYLKGNRDRSDPSYQRPLTSEGGERW